MVDGGGDRGGGVGGGGWGWVDMASSKEVLLGKELCWEGEWLP